MRTSANIIETLSSRVEDYAKTSIALLKFRAIETSIAGASSLVSALGGMFMIVLSAFFLSIGVALWLGDWLGKAQYGFFIVTLLYMIAAFVLRFLPHRYAAKMISTVDWQIVISKLETQQTIDAGLLKAELHEVYESVLPINLIKSTLKEAAESPDLHHNMLNVLMGLGTGYISKSILDHTSATPFRKVIGIALLFGAINLASKNPAIARTIGRTVFNLFNNSKK